MINLQLLFMLKKGKFHRDGQLNCIDKIASSPQSNQNSPSVTNIRFNKIQRPPDETIFNNQATAHPFSPHRTTSLVSSRRRRSNKQSVGLIEQQETANRINKNIDPRRKIGGLINISDMLRLFYDKLTFNSIYRQPVQFDPFQNNSHVQKVRFFCQMHRRQIPQCIQNILLILRVIYIIVYYFICPVSLLFTQISQAGPMIIIKVFGIGLGIVDLFEQLQTPIKKDDQSISSQEVQKIGEKRIQKITIQIAILISTVCSIGLSSEGLEVGAYLFLGNAFLMPYYLSQTKKLQDQFFTATHYQKYWDLAKVFVMNLFVCHLLACILIAITYIEPNNSWMTTYGIDLSPWYQQYLWSYYFGTTIILTIGFGDLHAANYIEATFIIFISFSACVFFGYNINCIGNMINSIRQQQVEMNNKLKILNTLAKKSKVSTGVYHEISNYIVQESKIKQESNYQQEKELLNQLPETLRSSFLRQANLKLFNQLKQMVPFTNSVIEKLSLSIEARICHPNQTIYRSTSSPCLMILQSGQMGLVAKIKGSRLNNLVIERIQCSLDEQSKIICANILSCQTLRYDIKSLGYSVIYELSKEGFELCVSSNKLDYEMYRQLLDACRYKPFEFAVVSCKFCQNKYHTMFECPRLHFQPFRHTLSLKYCSGPTVHKERQPRVKFARNKQMMYFQFAVEQSINALSSQSSLASKQHFPNFNAKLTHKPSAFKMAAELGGRKTGRESNQIIKGSNTNQLPKGRASYHMINSRNSHLINIELVNQIREEIKNLQRKPDTSELTFTLWDNVECDEACNFKNYFPKFNSCRLGERVIKSVLRNFTRNVMKKVKKND